MKLTRKALLALVCVLALLLGSLPVFAAQADFRYETGADGVTLTAYLGRSASPAIPAELDGKPVTAIGDGCFQGLLCLRTVRVPEGVKRIGDYAFECCGNLKKVYLPESLREIGEGAFSGCSALTLADLQDGVERIGRGAFLCCDALVTIELSDTLQTLGDFAFAWCSSLAHIGLGSSLRAVSDRTFYQCEALTRVVLPESVTSIGKRAFSHCVSLKGFYHGTELERLGEYAFENCESLESMNVRPVKLERGVFSGCTKLDWFSVADSVKSIGGEVFARSGVKSISLPASVTEIAADAFRGASPERVFVDAENAAFAEIDGSLCTKDGRTLLLACPGTDDEGEPAASYAVPDGVEIIESFAFNGRILDAVTLPDSLREIHAYAFAAAQIDSMDIPESVQVDPKAFVDPGADDEADAAAALSAQDAAPTEVKTTSAAGDKSLYREEDYKDYLAIDSDDFDAWSEEYLQYCAEHGSPVTQETIPYVMRYKGEVIPHFMAMTAVQNHDPDMWAQAANFFGDDFEQLYLMMNHGLFTELRRGKMPDHLVLYSGVYDSQLMAAAGTDHVPTQAELIAAIGSSFSDPCMISTTPNAPVACGFGETLFIIYASREAMEAQGAVNIDAVAHSSEQEILMSANARYRVLDVGAMTVTYQDPWAEEPETLERNYVRLELLAPETPNPFVDVADDAFYHDAVLWAVKAGVTDGMDETHFVPQGEATRAQIVTFLHRAAGSPAPKSEKRDFTDVKPDAWYAEAVRWAVEQGITNGTSPTTFSPDKACTRSEIVTFLHRAAGSPAPAQQTCPFTDVPAGSYYEKPVLWAVEQQITNGVSETTFAPNKTCTRGEAVTFLYRANG